MRLIYDGRYAYTGLWRSQASCWLRVYVPDGASDLPIVIAAELPDNDGTSVTNFAERLAWNVAHDSTVWAAAPHAAREGFIWIEHYPREPGAKAGDVLLDEHFSLVTFTYDRENEASAGNLGTISVVSDEALEELEADEADGMSVEDLIERQVYVASNEPQGTLGEPKWQRVPRARVEQMIGQTYGPLG